MGEIKTAEQLMADIAIHHKECVNNLFMTSCQVEMNKKEYISVADLLMDTYDSIQVNYTKTAGFYNVILTIGC